MNKNFINLGVSFNNILKKYPTNIAIQFNEIEKYTYRDLNFFSEKIVNLFKKLKIKKNNIIAIESSKNIFTFSTIVACWKSGVTYSFFDANDKSQRINKIFKILNPLKIFTFEKRRNLKNEYYFYSKH